GTHPFDVEPVARTELQLQAQKTVADLLRALRHVVGIAEPDRPRRRRTGTPEAEQAPHWHVRELALQVVQRGVDRGARGELLAGGGRPWCAWGAHGSSRGAAGSAEMSAPADWADSPSRSIGAPSP